MIVVAHVGHWAVQVIYVAPLLVMVGVVLVGRIRERRRASHSKTTSDSQVAPPSEERRTSPPGTDA